MTRISADHGTIDGSVAATSYSVKGAYNVESFDGYGCKNCENCKMMIFQNRPFIRLCLNIKKLPTSVFKNPPRADTPHEDLSKKPTLLSQDLSKIPKLNLPLLWIECSKKRGRYPRSGHCKKTKITLRSFNNFTSQKNQCPKKYPPLHFSRPLFFGLVGQVTLQIHRPIFFWLHLPPLPLRSIFVPLQLFLALPFLIESWIALTPCIQISLPGKVDADSIRQQRSSTMVAVSFVFKILQCALVWERTWMHQHTVFQVE